MVQKSMVHRAYIDHCVHFLALRMVLTIFGAIFTTSKGFKQCKLPAGIASQEVMSALLQGFLLEKARSGW